MKRQSKIYVELDGERRFVSLRQAREWQRDLSILRLEAVATVDDLERMASETPEAATALLAGAESGRLAGECFHACCELIDRGASLTELQRMQDRGLEAIGAGRRIMAHVKRMAETLAGQLTTYGSN